MNDLLTVIGSISTVYWLITIINSEFLPKSLGEIIYSFKNGTVKAWRILHPILILLWYYEPQSWWKIIIMMVTIELSFHIATPIANWVCNKLGF